MSLLELLVALAVTSAVMVGVVATVSSQQRAYYNGQQVRSAQASARTALLQLEQRISMAGFGMDPALAFDFTQYGVASGEGAFPATRCPAEMGSCPRDSTTNSDEIVFYARNPLYRLSPTPIVGHAWTLTAAPTVTTATLSARVGDRFAAGQVLLAVCSSNPDKFAYFTVAQNYPLGAGSPPPTVGVAGAAPLTLSAVSAGDPFRRQDLATDSCFANALVFQIDRFRYHVRPVQTGTVAGKIQYDPYLVLDQGIDRNGDGAIDASDELLIAEGIELIQFAYVFANGAVAPAGASAGVPITFTAETLVAPQIFGTLTADTIFTTIFPGPAASSGINPYFTSSWYPYASTSAARLVNNQANIKAVKIGILARSPDADVTSKVVRVDSTFSLFNLQATASAPAWIRQNFSRGSGDDGYQRVVLVGTVPVPNMDLRAMTVF